MDNKTAAELLNVQRKRLRKTITFSLYPETLDMIAQMAELTGAAKSRIVEQAIYGMYAKALRIQKASKDDHQ